MNMTENIIQGVWDICNQFIIDGKGMHVSLNEEGMERTAQDIKEKLKDMEGYWIGYPKCLNPEISKNIAYEILAYELIADSINYQYWYGKHDIRPNGACATKMYNLLNESFEEVGDSKKIIWNDSWTLCEEAIENFIVKISIHRFPNLENRIKHLKEISESVKHKGQDIIKYLSNGIVNKSINVNDFLKIIISRYPGYAKDMFLKRAFLLPIMLYRRVKWFEDEIELLPVPADYQIPKMLEGLGCINYDYILSEKIQNYELIHESSLEECEIRAATMLAGKRLSELSGLSMCDIDTYLWLKRKEINKPFHLTITTNY